MTAVTLLAGVPPLWARLFANDEASREGARVPATASPPAPALPMALIASELCRRRQEERRLAYCECHDQSLVGDQSLAFRLMGSDMCAEMRTLLGLYSDFTRTCAPR